MKGQENRATAYVTLSLLVAVAALVLAACGSSSPTTAEARPASSTAAASTSPAPTPTTNWTPGAPPIPAATFPAQGGLTAGLHRASIGWAFKPTVDIQVTDLGFYDEGGNGLRHAHPVGVYDVATKRLLASGTVLRDSPLQGFFRWVKIRAVTLKAGKSYMVVAYKMPPFDPEPRDPYGLVWAPQIKQTYTAIAIGATKLVFPEGAGHGLGMDMNFKFRPLSAATPAP